MRVMFTTTLTLAALGSVAPAQTVIDGANLAQRSSGVATGGTGWTLGSNGYVGTCITLANAGTVTLSINAGGQSDAGVLPKMDIVVDDTIAPFTVATGKNSYSTSLSLPAGTHFVRTEFANASANRKLTITNDGRLDLSSTNLLLTDSIDLAALRQQLQTGYADGAWTGSGINSSQAAAVAADASNLHKTGIGFEKAGEGALLSYHLFGDVNLDAVVNALDFNAVASNFGSSNEIWSGGDFNCDGVVDTSDFAMFAANFGAALPVSVGSIVPEPSAWLLLLASLRLFRRRVRR